MELQDLTRILSVNPYPGRGILLGRTKDSRYAVAAYFIMGRSLNSRNRVFIPEGDGLRTQAFDPSKMTDPSLIIYSPVRVCSPYTIVTNGDQTDTIYEGLARGLSLEESLRSRTFEPDAPNYTPRISGLMKTQDGTYSYQLSILKSSRGDAASCERFTFSYDPAMPGEGRFISTYVTDGSPLPSFEGEPIPVVLDGSIDTLSTQIWNALNAENKVSLFVRYIDIATGETDTRIFNKMEEGK